MGDENRRALGTIVDPTELVLHVLSRKGIEGAEGFIEEQYVWLVCKNARECDALLHPAGELVGPFGPEIPQLHEFEVMANPLGTLLRLQTAHPRTECDVALHGQPGVELRFLENEPPPPVGAVYLLALVEHDTLVRLQEPRHEAKDRCLPASGRPDDRHELPALDAKGELLDRRDDAGCGAVGKRNVA